MGRIVAIIAVTLLLGFGAYKIFASSVDRKDQNAVGKAFLKQLKKEEVSKAAKYYVPAEAEAWEAEAKGKLFQMKSNAMGMFRDAIPDEPTFAAVPANKLPKPVKAGDTYIQAGDTMLGMRQIDGDWYVSSSTVP